MDISHTAMKNLAKLIVFAALLLAVVLHLNAVGTALQFLWGVVFPLLLGGALAFIFNVPVRFLEKKLFPKGGGKKKRLPASARRGLSLLLTLLLTVLVIALLVLVIVPQLATSIASLGTTILEGARHLATWAEAQFSAYPQVVEWLKGLSIDWESLLSGLWEFITNGAGSVVSSTISATMSVFGAVSTGFIAFVFAIYILLQKEKLGLQCRKALFALLPEKAATKVVNICSLSNRVFSSFITGQFVEAVILGSMFVVAMAILRMPYALLIGCMIAVTALIPIVGAFIGCIVGAFLLLMVSPIQAGIFVILFLVLQQVEGNLIYPRVVGASVGLPSIWVLAAVSVGGSLMGIFGMLLFIPLVSVCYTLFREFVYNRLRQKGLCVQ